MLECYRPMSVKGKQTASLVSNGTVPRTETSGWFQGCLLNTTHITKMVSAGKMPWMEKKAVPSSTRARYAAGGNQDCTAVEHQDRAPGCTCWSHWSCCPVSAAITTERAQTSALLPPAWTQRGRGCTGTDTTTGISILAAQFLIQTNYLSRF